MITEAEHERERYQSWIKAERDNRMIPKEAFEGGKVGGLMECEIKKIRIEKILRRPGSPKEQLMMLSWDESALTAEN